MVNAGHKKGAIAEVPGVDKNTCDMNTDTPPNHEYRMQSLFASEKENI